jgi:hypothetical protein
MSIEFVIFILYRRLGFVDVIIYQEIKITKYLMFIESISLGKWQLYFLTDYLEEGCVVLSSDFITKFFSGIETSLEKG